MIELQKILKEKTLHEFFKIGVVIKGLDGCLELLGSFLLILINPERLNRLVAAFTQHELSEDPNDFFATAILRATEHLSVSTKMFEAAYLFTHGMIKIFLVWGLLKNKLWSYPTSIAFLLTFMGYQVYRYMHTHSLSLIALTIFDAIIIVLVWHEYNFVKKRFPFKNSL